MLNKRFLDPFYRMFFTVWFRLSDHLVFRAHHYHGSLPKGEQATLLLCNHISWWDGAWMLLWNHKRLFKSFHVLMLARELEKRPFLRSLGAVGLLQGRQLPQTVAELSGICRKPNGLLLIFPQGEIRAAQEGPIRFQMGLLKRLPLEEVQLAFAFNAVEYGNKVRPAVFHFIEAIQSTPVESIEKEYEAFVVRCKAVVAAEVERLIRQP